MAWVRIAAAAASSGPTSTSSIKPFDETNTRVRSDRIVADIKRSGGKALICLVGVQSNQFPRAVDLARQFLKAGLPVAMGGFHAAGCLSMLPVVPPEIQAAMDMGISIFAGEAEEGRLDTILLDAWNGTLKPLYNYMDDLPGIEGAPTPSLPPAALARNEGRKSSFDLGRGCPFQCSFCTIINVQGRKSRFRNADDLEAIVRENYKQGITSFFITDDNMARNKHWEDFFDRLIELKENEGIEVSLIIQVDTQCHRIPNFIHKARWAGVYRVFIGLENVNPDNLLAAKKRQNKITEYRKMLQAWHTSGASTWAGYILGFPGDTRESILRDMEIIKKELPLDILELFMLTPLPGSEDHQTLWKQGVWMDPDLNKYDLHHRVVHHPKMSDAEYEQTYRDAWKTYYTPEHIRDGGAAPRRDPRPQSRRARAVHDHVQDHVRGRGHPSAGRRHRAPEVPARPPLRHEDRAVRRVPLQAGARELEEAQDLRAARLAGLAHRPVGQERPQAPRIHGSRAVAGGRGGSRQARAVRRDGGRRGGAQQAPRRGSGPRQGRRRAEPGAPRSRRISSATGVP